MAEQTERMEKAHAKKNSMGHHWSSGSRARCVYGLEAMELGKIIDKEDAAASAPGASYGPYVSITNPNSTYLNWVEPETRHGL